MDNYSLTIFKSAFDNKTDKTMEFDSWSDFVKMLESLSKIPYKSKQEASLISPAKYKPDTTRANRNVAEWGKWAAVDVDDYTGDINDIIDRFRDNSFCIYSTASSTDTQSKFRIVFDLSRRVEEVRVKHFWYALNIHVGELGDTQTKDSSRMYYVPGNYEGAANFFIRNDGIPLDVDVLLRKHEYVESSGNSFLDKLPDEVRRQVLQHRREQMTNTDVTWSGYLDCPFFPNKMAIEYKSISGQGWYSQMYRIMIATACNAIKAKYPITASEVSKMCKQLDEETGQWYKHRPLEREANGAIDWAYANVNNEE